MLMLHTCCHSMHTVATSPLLKSVILYFQTLTLGYVPGSSLPLENSASFFSLFPLIYILETVSRKIHNTASSGSGLYGLGVTPSGASGLTFSSKLRDHSQGVWGPYRLMEIKSGSAARKISTIMTLLLIWLSEYWGVFRHLCLRWREVTDSFYDLPPNNLRSSFRFAE